MGTPCSSSMNTRCARARTPMLEGGLMPRMRCCCRSRAADSLHECRDYIGGKGSFDTTMAGLIYTLEQSRKNESRRNSLLRRTSSGLTNSIWTSTANGLAAASTCSASVPRTRRGNPADSYRKDEGVVFTFNGQCQAFFSKDFFRRKAVGARTIWLTRCWCSSSCSAIGVRANEKLFMPNRENLRHGDLEFRLEGELMYLKDHTELERKARSAARTRYREPPRSQEVVRAVRAGDGQQAPGSASASFGAGFGSPIPSSPRPSPPSAPGRFPTGALQGPRSWRRAEAWRERELPSPHQLRHRRRERLFQARRATRRADTLPRSSTASCNPQKNWGTPRIFEGDAAATFVAAGRGRQPEPSLSKRRSPTLRVSNHSEHRFSLAVHAERGCRARRALPRHDPDQ